MTRVWKVFLVLTALLLSLPTAFADDFYVGRSMTLISGQSAGSSYDMSSRLVGRHLGRNIAGQPNIVSTNMPGAAGLLAANYLFNRAPQDGSVMLAALQALAQRQVMGEANVKYDTARMQWIGSVQKSVNVLYVWHTAPIKTIEEARTTEIAMAVTAPGSASAGELALANNLLGTRFRAVTGYPGSRATVAIEQGEVQGRTGESYTGLKVIHRDWLTDRKIRILLQFGREKDPELQSVPLAMDLAKNEQDRKILEFAALPLAIGRPFVTGQDVPATRTSMLRAAFDATMKDPQFLADAKKINFHVAPTSWKEVQELIAITLAAPPNVIENARQYMAQD